MLDILGELIFEGLAGGAGNSKIPKWVQPLLFSLLCAVPITILRFLLVASYKSADSSGTVICAIILLGLIFLWLFGCFKIIKAK